MHCLFRRNSLQIATKSKLGMQNAILISLLSQQYTPKRYITLPLAIEVGVCIYYA